MKMIIISPYQFRLKRGIERFTYSIANKLAQRGIVITIYCWAAMNDAIDWGEWDPGIRFRKVPAFRYFQSFAASLYYSHWLKKDQPGIIAINFLYHGEHRLPPTKNYLYILHSPASLVTGRYQFVKEHVGRFSSIHFVAVSEMVKRESLPFLENKNVKVIYNGVDTSHFVPANKNRGIALRKIKVITAAALEERKGIQHLITLLGNADEKTKQTIHYDIYGDGPYKGALEELISLYGLNACVRILQPVNNLQELLPEYDLFCLLSKGEAMGLVVLEAMACGLPILCSNLAPFDEFVTADFGLRANPDNNEQILEFILNLKHPETRNQYADKARLKSMEFTWEKTADNYMGLFNEWKIA